MKQSLSNVIENEHFCHYEPVFMASRRPALCNRPWGNVATILLCHVALLPRHSQSGVQFKKLGITSIIPPPLPKKAIRRMQGKHLDMLQSHGAPLPTRNLRRSPEWVMMQHKRLQLEWEISYSQKNRLCMHGSAFHLCTGLYGSQPISLTLSKLFL